MRTSFRHLPHQYVIGEPMFVTFRLHGSLPPGREFSNRSLTSGQAFACMDRLLHEQRFGPMHLAMREIARVVVDAIQGGACEDYDLHTWVVMPNHVHLLFTPRIEIPRLMRRLKGTTAREANRILNLTGKPFWQDESYDRLVRNPEEFGRIENYIVQNPVKAGLVNSAEEFPWSGGGLKGRRRP